MKVEAKYLNDLKQLVEKSAMHPIRTSKDFESLHWQIQERLNTTVGITTLKRLWGYVEGYDTVRISTLDILCRYAGFPDWHTFLADYCRIPDAETSRRMVSSVLESAMLQVGAELAIEWNPARHVHLLHKGSGIFEVMESINSKLSVGDTFHCERFILNQPLYMDRYIHLDQDPAFFAVGMQGGLTKLIQFD